MSKAHLSEPVAGCDLLARVGWCREGALLAEKKAPQASSRLCGAAGHQDCTSLCRFPLARVMRGRKTSEWVLRGCAHRKREAVSRPGRSLLARHIAEVGLAWTVPPHTTYFGLPSVCVVQVGSSSVIPPCTIARPSGTAAPPPSPPPPTASPMPNRGGFQTPPTRSDTTQSGFTEAVQPLGRVYSFTSIVDQPAALLPRSDPPAVPLRPAHGPFLSMLLMTPMFC